MESITYLFELNNWFFKHEIQTNSERMEKDKAIVENRSPLLSIYYG
jgi:hypothetical protein